MDDHERPPQNPGPSTPNKDPPILGAWPLWLAANLVSGGCIYLDWKTGTFWTGPKCGGSVLLGLIVFDLIFFYYAIRERK